MGNVVKFIWNILLTLSVEKIMVITNNGPHFYLKTYLFYFFL